MLHIWQTHSLMIPVACSANQERSKITEDIALTDLIERPSGLPTQRECTENAFADRLAQYVLTAGLKRRTSSAPAMLDGTPETERVVPDHGGEPVAPVPESGIVQDESV